MWTKYTAIWVPNIGAGDKAEPAENKAEGADSVIDQKAIAGRQ